MPHADPVEARAWTRFVLGLALGLAACGQHPMERLVEGRSFVLHQGGHCYVLELAGTPRWLSRLRARRVDCSAVRRWRERTGSA